MEAVANDWQQLSTLSTGGAELADQFEEENEEIDADSDDNLPF